MKKISNVIKLAFFAFCLCGYGLLEGSANYLRQMHGNTVTFKQIGSIHTKNLAELQARGSSEGLSDNQLKLAQNLSQNRIDTEHIMELAQCSAEELNRIECYLDGIQRQTFLFGLRGNYAPVPADLVVIHFSIQNGNKKYEIVRGYLQEKVIKYALQKIQIPGYYALYQCCSDEGAFAKIEFEEKPAIKKKAITVKPDPAPEKIEDERSLDDLVASIQEQPKAKAKPKKGKKSSGAGSSTDLAPASAATEQEPIAQAITPEVEEKSTAEEQTPETKTPAETEAAPATIKRRWSNKPIPQGQ